MTPRLRALAAPAASAGLLALAFPRFDQGWIAWFALVPLLAAVHGAAPRRAAALGWTTGFLFFVATIYWIPATISNFTAVPPLAAGGILVLLAAVAAWAYAALAWSAELAVAAGVSRLVAVPAAWAVIEWMRGFVVAEFPWNLLGYTQMRYIAMPQAADLGGVYLLSAAIVACNVALAEAVGTWREKGWIAWNRLALAVACPVLLYAYGTARLAGLDATPYTGSIRVAVAQGNIAQDQKWDEALQDSILARYLDLTEQAASAGAQLVVWPEAAVPFYLQRDMRSVEIVDVARRRGIDLLVGAPGVEDRDGKGPVPYNQAWLIRGDGGVEGPYDKIQLVPFGEYVPLHGLFGLVDVAVQSIGEFGRGTEHTIFETVPLSAPDGSPATPDDAPLADAPSRDRDGDRSGARAVRPPTVAGGDAVAATAAPGDPATDAGRRARFATLICYEGIFPGLVREFAAGHPDFLVNISNDAWYGDTAAPNQHLEMAAMRAIENRLPLVRSTNTGISAFVTDEGWIGDTTPLFHQDMVVESVLVRRVWSFYREYGDVFLHLCQATVALVGLRLVRRRGGRPAAAA